MGQSKKFKDKAQAGQVFSSAGMGQGGDLPPISQVESEVIVFSLIRLRPDIVVKASENDVIEIEVLDSVFHAYTKHGIVGEVPEEIKDEIIEKKLFKGYVVKMSPIPPYYGLKVALTH